MDETQTSSGKSNRPARKKLKLTYKEQQEYEHMEENIEQTEAKLQKIKDDMLAAASDYDKVQQLMIEQQQLVQELDSLLERWTYLEERVAEIEAHNRSL